MEGRKIGFIQAHAEHKIERPKTPPTARTTTTTEKWKKEKQQQKKERKTRYKETISSSYEYSSIIQMEKNIVSVQKCYDIVRRVCDKNRTTMQMLWCKVMLSLTSSFEIFVPLLFVRKGARWHTAMC